MSITLIMLSEHFIKYHKYKFTISNLTEPRLKIIAIETSSYIQTHSQKGTLVDRSPKLKIKVHNAHYIC